MMDILTDTFWGLCVIALSTALLLAIVKWPLEFVVMSLIVSILFMAYLIGHEFVGFSRRKR